MLHIYCGDGKGKTTAALGLAIRAAGAGLRVHIVQLMKGAPTSELAALRAVSGVTVARCDRDYGFFPRMTEQDKAQIAACHNRLLAEGFAAVRSGEADMLILDEFCAAYAHGLLDRQAADRFLLKEEHGAEIVLTGRDPEEKYLEKADYVSEIRCVRHPYRTGTAARKGIEL